MKWAYGSSDCPRCDIFGAGEAIGSAAQAGASIAGAGIQARAVNNAVEAQRKSAQEALGFQRDVYGNQQAQQAPYIQSGGAALGFLNEGLGLQGGGIGPSSLVNQVPYNNPNFNATLNNPQFGGQYQDPGDFSGKVDVTQDPGYQFRMDEALKALQRNMAATGVAGGNAVAAVNDLVQGKASQEYGNAYQRALQTYAQNQNNRQTAFQDQLAGYNANAGNAMNTFNSQLAGYNANTGNALNQYNAQKQNQQDVFNRYATVAGIGQTGTQQLGAAGQNAAMNMGNLYGQMGNAASAGSIGMGNAINQGIGGVGNAISNYMLYRKLGNAQGPQQTFDDEYDWQD